MKVEGGFTPKRLINIVRETSSSWAVGPKDTPNPRGGMRSLCRGLIYVNKNCDNLSHLGLQRNQLIYMVIFRMARIHPPRPLFFFALILLSGSSVWAVERAEERALAVGCTGCHGEQGEGLGAFPSIKGLSQRQFVERFEHFARSDQERSVMHRIAKAYSGEEIRRLAHIFAGETP